MWFNYITKWHGRSEICQNSRNKPLILFVVSRKMSVVTVLISDGEPQVVSIDFDQTRSTIEQGYNDVQGLFFDILTFSKYLKKELS